MKQTAKDRFFKKIKISSTKCWVWIGGRDSSGYGVFFSFYLKSVGAHRFSYELHKGKIPKGFEVDHLCRNRACVNPDHLEAVTKRENIIRGKKLITHCPKKHPYSGDNLYVYPDGRRGCRKCMQINSRERYESKNLLPDLR